MLDNIFFRKLHVFKINRSLYHNLILFSEKIYKRQVEMFYQNHSLTLHTVETFCNLILRNLTWTWKISDCFTGLGLTLWYNGLGLEKYLNYLTGLGLVLWYIGVRLKYLDYLGFELILGYIGLGLEKRFNLLESDWFYYNQGRMLLEKSENSLELSVKQ